MKKLLCLCLLCSFNVHAEECLAIDSEKTRIVFEVEQAGTPFEGSFKRSGGEACLENGAITRIDAWFDPASADTGLPELDVALAGEQFFATKEFPRASFRSDRIERTAEGFIAHGSLTMKGTSKPFELPFVLEQSGDGYHASGEASVRRLEFGIGTGEWSDTAWLADEVKARFSIVAGGANGKD